MYYIAPHSRIRRIRDHNRTIKLWDTTNQNIEGRSVYKQQTKKPDDSDIISKNLITHHLAIGAKI
jgi:hypothetical protein